MRRSTLWLLMAACTGGPTEPPEDGIVIEEWTNLVARIDAAEARIDELTTDNADLDTRLQASESQLADLPSLRSQVSTHEAAIEALDLRLAAVELELGQTRAELDTTSTTLSGALTNITVVDSRLATVEVDVGDQATSLGDLAARLVVAEAQLAELPASSVITTDNVDDITPLPGEQVQLTTLLTLVDSYDLLDVDELQINGGGFIGGPGIQLELGRDITFTNTHFEDVDIDGRDISFVNCSFEGEIAFPSDAHIVGGRILRVNQATVRMLSQVTGAEIDSSTLVRVDRIANSDISESTLGGTTVNSNHLGRITGSEIRDSLLYAGRGSSFTGNEFDESTLLISAAQFSSVTIAANIFEQMHSTRAEAISIDAESSWFAQVSVVGNSFMGNDSVPTHIRVEGVAAGNYQGLTIAGNTLMRGGQAITYTGTLPIVVTGNTTRGTVLGVSTGTTLTVFDNTEL